MPAQPDPPPTPEEVCLDACQEIVDRYFDAATVDAVRIDGHTAQGRPFSVPIEPKGRRGRPATLKTRILTEMSKEDFKKPAKPATIARKMGRSCSGHFKQVLKAMADEGTLTLTDGDYWVASRPIPNDLPKPPADGKGVSVRLVDGNDKPAA